MNFAISDLRERPEFFDAVADRIWRAWWEPNGHPLNSITERLTQNLAGPGVPIALVAHRGDEFLGTASLIVSDLDERPQYAPWVAAVWTEPDARGQGIGRALVSRARDEAFALAHDRVYLCARPVMRSYYLELGWTLIEDNIGPSAFDVFVRRKPDNFSRK